MNISNIEKYVEQKNAWGKIFGKEPLSLLNAADRQRIAGDLDSDLSPENLTCDGEVRGRALQSKAKYLYRCVEELRSIDPSVVFQEA